jgi:hypothetical protein
MRTLFLLLVLASPAAAQEAVTAEEFEALVTGRTLTYGAPGEAPYGIEHYFPNRRVTWALGRHERVPGGRLVRRGARRRPGDLLHLPGRPRAPVLALLPRGDGLRAEFLEDGGATVLYELLEKEGGLVCGGVGV